MITIYSFDITKKIGEAPERKYIIASSYMNGLKKMHNIVRQLDYIGFRMLKEYDIDD